MICAWQPLLGILPGWLRNELDRSDRDRIQELRLRVGDKPELYLGMSRVRIGQCVQQIDLDFIINAASRYSPWAAGTLAHGFLTAPGGHRIGICGDVVLLHGSITGMKNLTSLCIRIARDYPGIGYQISKASGSTILLGPPGSGKTTMLRDVLRNISGSEPVSVVDERGEIFPKGFTRGSCVDVLYGCGKEAGIEILLRTMGPSCIGVDEITTESDCDSLVRAGWCGVRMVATAHASSVSDLRNRPVYRRLWESGLFQQAVVLQRDKTWRMERIAG